jgi:serine protease
MPLRAVGIGGGLVSDVADAILFSAGLLTTEDGRVLPDHLPIVNLSFGLVEDAAELRSACMRAANIGVLLVGATGNTGTRVLYPAKYDSVLAVSAVDRRLDTTQYSNFGDEVEIAAPGGLGTEDAAAAGWPDSVLSCGIDETVFPAVPSQTLLDGTSQAAPHVAGAAALLLSVDPTLSRQELKVYLLGSVRDRGQPGWDDAYGWGFLQALEALRLLMQDRGTPISTPPELLLGATSVLFDGFDDRHEIMVMNRGGGRLEFSDPAVATDDGADWLGAENVPQLGSGPTAVARVAVTVDHLAFPPGTRHLGTVFVRDDAGVVLGTIRVVVLEVRRMHAGRNLAIAIRDAGTDAVEMLGFASPALGYRYWTPVLDPGSYKVMAGTDLDGDGFFCELGDGCGWHGGATAPEAVVVELERDETVFDVDVTLTPPLDG